MSFISYAQNFEDVILWRALKGETNGFYIDVGAGDPTIDSVSKAFYEMGWCGINVELSASAFEKLCSERPRDICLDYAIREKEGEFTFYEIPINGWSTTMADTAAKVKAAGIVVKERQGPAKTLAQVCSEYVKGNIHFLKIDVEGAEEFVIRGMDFSRWRPWILVIEATFPNSTILSHGSWEPLVLSAGYMFVYFDGLNRFYVAQEHADLAAAISLPPNVHDDFKMFNCVQKADLQEAIAKQDARIAVLQETIARQDVQKADLQETIAKQEAQMAVLKQTIADHEMTLRAIQSSRGWKLIIVLKKFFNPSR